MCKKLLIATSIIILFAPLVAGASLATPTGGSISESAVELMVNRERQEAGLSALSHNSLLAQAAQAKADDMAQKSYFSHTSPEGKQFQYWVEAAGYKYWNTGENLAVHTVDDAEAIVSSWMNSPGHRANIVSGKFSETGIGVAYGTYQGQPTIFVAQLFGNPREAVVQAAPQVVTSAQVVAQPVVPQPIIQFKSAESQQPKVAGTTTSVSKPVEVAEPVGTSVTIESEIPEILEAPDPIEPPSQPVAVRSLTFKEFVGGLLSSVSDFFSHIALALVA